MFVVAFALESWTRAQSNPGLAAAACALGLLVAFFFFKPFFGGWSGFWECLKFWFTPDVISLLCGRLQDDRWSTLKLFVWAGLSFGTTVLAFYELPTWAPSLFPRVI